MGKRQRRKDREAGAVKSPKPQGRLGYEGPYMVCGICGEPLNVFTPLSLDGTKEGPPKRLHRFEYIDLDGNVAVAGPSYDHRPVPIEASPADADTICDFCHAPLPRYPAKSWVFVPRRPVVIENVLTGDPNDYSSPWSCCEGCLQAVKHRDITKMLDRAFDSPHSQLPSLPGELKTIFRREVRELYSKYLKSDPAGPYERKMRPAPKPLGKPGSKRGR